MLYSTAVHAILYCEVQRVPRGNLVIPASRYADELANLPAGIRQEIATVEVLAHDAPFLFNVHPAKVNLMVVQARFLLLLVFSSTLRMGCVYSK